MEVHHYSQTAPATMVFGVAGQTPAPVVVLPSVSTIPASPTGWGPPVAHVLAQLAADRTYSVAMALFESGAHRQAVEQHCLRHLWGHGSCAESQTIWH